MSLHEIVLAVHEHPDDVPRRVYADWLTEKGRGGPRMALGQRRCGVHPLVRWLSGQCVEVAVYL